MRSKLDFWLQSLKIALRRLATLPFKGLRKSSCRDAGGRESRIWLNESSTSNSKRRPTFLKCSLKVANLSLCQESWSRLRELDCEPSKGLCWIGLITHGFLSSKKQFDFGSVAEAVIPPPSRGDSNVCHVRRTCHVTRPHHRAQRSTSVGIGKRVGTPPSHPCTQHYRQSWWQRHDQCGYPWHRPHFARPGSHHSFVLQRLESQWAPRQRLAPG